MAEKKEYQIRIQEQMIPVSEEIYLTYYRMRRREKHLEEKDARHGTVLYSSMDTDEITGEDAIPDLKSPKVEDVVLDRLMYQLLHHCIIQLSKQEQELIEVLFFQGKSEREWSAESGIPQKTINDRRHKVITKLKKLMKI